MTRILVVDNYDSFVHNVVHYLAQIGAEVEIRRNDDEWFSTPGWHTGYDGVLLSPGPGGPEAAGVCIEVVQRLGGQIPVFGICLGLQAIGVAFGAVVDRAPELLHGKTSLVHHDGQGIFTKVPDPFTATRYHSLAIVPDSLPPELEISARTGSGTIMAVRHRTWPIEAVQFHPESVLTEHGYLMLGNWLGVCGDTGAPARATGMSPLTTVALS